MIALALALTVGSTDVVRNERFYVSGWLCVNPGCSGSRRRLRPGRIALDADRSVLPLPARDTKSQWNVTLLCRVRADRLAGCKFDEGDEAAELSSAKAVAANLRLMPGGVVDGQSVLVSIQYDAGICPPWRCSIVPPPPAPPPSPAS